MRKVNLLLLIFAIVFCAAPLIIGQGGYNTRAFALLLPVAAAGRRAPMKILLILIFLAAAFDFLLTVLFFRQVLV